MKRISYNYLFIILNALIFVSLYSCSSIGAAKGPSFKPVVDYSQEKVVIYIYKRRLYGRNIYKLRVNGQTFTKLQKGGYYVLYVPPGRIKIATQQHTVSSVDFNAEAGKTYYVKMKSGLNLGLYMVPEETAMNELPKCVLLETFTELHIDQELDGKLFLSRFNGKIVIEKGDVFTSEIAEFLRSSPFRATFRSTPRSYSYPAIQGDVFGDIVTYRKLEIFLNYNGNVIIDYVLE